MVVITRWSVVRQASIILYTKFKADRVEKTHQEIRRFFEGFFTGGENIKRGLQNQNHFSFHKKFFNKVLQVQILKEPHIDLDHCGKSGIFLQVQGLLGPPVSTLKISLNQTHLFGLIIQQCNKLLNRFQLLEANHILFTYSTLPNSPCGSS